MRSLSKINQNLFLKTSYSQRLWPYTRTIPLSPTDRKNIFLSDLTQHKTVYFASIFSSLKTHLQLWAPKLSWAIWSYFTSQTFVASNNEFLWNRMRWALTHQLETSGRGTCQAKISRKLLIAYEISDLFYYKHMGSTLWLLCRSR